MSINCFAREAAQILSRCVIMPRIFLQFVKNLTFPLSLVGIQPRSTRLSLLTCGIDYHHDILNPSSIPPSEIIKRADVIWKRRGIRPKQHLSEPRPGAVTLMERRAHADRCETLPADLPDDMGKFFFL